MVYFVAFMTKKSIHLRQKSREMVKRVVNIFKNLGYLPVFVVLYIFSL